MSNEPERSEAAMREYIGKHLAIIIEEADKPYPNSTLMPSVNMIVAFDTMLHLRQIAAELSNLTTIAEQLSNIEMTLRGEQKLL